MNPFVIAFCGCLLFFQAYGQPYVVDLQSHPLTIAQRNFYVSRVIDARTEKDNIGATPIGTINPQPAMQFKSSLPEELMGLFTKSFSPVPNQEPVLVKVLKFQIREKGKSLFETSSAEVMLQFIYEKAPGTYLNLCQAQSLVESRGSNHDENLIAALADCFTQLAKKNRQELISRNEEIPASQLEESLMASTQEIDCAILKDTVYKPGVYVNFREFRNNAPGIAQAVVIDRKSGPTDPHLHADPIVPYLLDIEGKKKGIRNAWGVSDGKSLYVSYGGNYYPLKKTHNLFTFFGHEPDKQSGIRVKDIVGGAVVNMPPPAATAHQGQTEYMINMLTGRVSEKENYAYAPDRLVRIIIYYREDKDGMDDLATVLLKSNADSLSIELEPNSFAELQWNNPLSDIMACVVAEEDTCTPFMPDHRKTNYLEYIPAGKLSETGVLRSVAEKKGTFYLKQIRYAQEVEDKRNRRK